MSKNPPESSPDPAYYNTLVFLQLPRATNEIHLFEFLICAAILSEFQICFQLNSWIEMHLATPDRRDLTEQ